MQIILNQDNEEKQWDIYCAVTANPFADDVGSFDEFRQKFNNTATRKEMAEPTEPIMNNAQMNLQVEKANKILSGFVPPVKRGG